MNELNYNQELELQAEEFLEQGNTNAEREYATFYIDVTGKHSVYHTLWRFQNNVTSAYVKNPTYICNLPQNILEAAKKARQILPAGYIQIDRSGVTKRLNPSPDIMKFGKYRGEHIGDVFAKDPKYLVWVSNNITGLKQATQEILKSYVEMYFATVIKQNQEKTSHFGNIGDKITVDAEIYDKSEYYDNYADKPSYKVKFVDKEGHRFYTFTNTMSNFNKGDIVKVEGIIKNHTEKLGVRFTYLNRVKVLQIIKQNTMNESKMFKITQKQLIQLNKYLKESITDNEQQKSHDQNFLISKRANEKSIELSNRKITFGNEVYITKVNIRKSENFTEFFSVWLEIKNSQIIIIEYTNGKLSYWKQYYNEVLDKEGVNQLNMILSECFNYIQESPEKIYSPQVEEFLTTHTNRKEITI
jgi:hypothetical protein